MTDLQADPATHIHSLPNNTYVVETRAGDILVNCPPETLKYLLAHGLKPPRIILLPPDMPAGKQLGSSGFVRQGINYASVEFLLYSNFYGGGGQRTRLITATLSQAQRLRLILDETIIGPTDPAAYGDYKWLKHECDAVGYYEPLGGMPQTHDLAEFTSLETGGGELSGIRITLEGERFVFREEGAVIATLPTLITGTPTPLSLAPARPLLRQELTLQFIGGSDGFDPVGITTCFLAYLGNTAQTKATLFDAAAYLRMRLGNLGISPGQISEVVLSHLHEDHLAGLPELLLMGDHRVRLLTSDIIHASLLRLLSAMLALPERDVAALFDFYPLNPGHPVQLEGRRFEAIYAIHSIPTIAVRANALYYSGDMRYDENWFEELVKQGVLTPARRDELIHFAEGASVLVQDAGGGAVHTSVTPEIIKALAAKGQRLILAHISKSKQSLPEDDAEWAGQVEFASSGYISGMGGVVASAEAEECLETLSACPLFARLSLEERVQLSRAATLTQWEDKQSIIHEGDASDGQTYIVHSGLVEVWAKGEMLRVIGRGTSVGERGALQGEVRTSSLIGRGKTQLLGLSAEVFQPVAERLNLPAAFDRADWLWAQSLFKDLPWGTLLDLALDFRPRHLAPGDTLFTVGEPGYEAYLLISGIIAVVDKEGQLIEELQAPGEFFGGRAALYGRLRNASSAATRESEVWALPSAALQRLQIVYPNILLHLRAVEAARHGQRPANAP